MLSHVWVILLYSLAFVLTCVLPPASNMKAPASGASLATAAPAAEETPKAAVPSEAQSSSLEIKLILHSRRSRLVALLSL